MKREFLQNLKVGDQPLSKEVIDAIMEENGRDIEGAKVWQEKYNQAVAQHETQLRQLRFDSVLEQAILLAKGRSAKAITALLDVEALQKSENLQEDVNGALETLKKDHGYLFHSPERPPLYARGTGSQTGADDRAPTSLAGALKERFEKERK